MGGCVARTVPSSGIVTAASASSSKELGVGPVDLVEQQHGRPGTLVLDRLEQRTAQQVLLAEQIRLLQFGMAGLRHADSEHLSLVVPLVERLAGVDALVALQPVQRRVEQPGESLCRLGLAHPGLALEQNRLGQPHGQEQRCRQTHVGEVVVAVEGRHQGCDVGDQPHHVVLRARPRRAGHRAPPSAASTRS
jgi:hypothetical protein